jgi:signal transduction histidine kinase
MRPEDFRPDDLFAQIQGLVDRLADERRAREAAEAADKAKSDLLTMVGHELRTPMEAVVAMAELMPGQPARPHPTALCPNASVGASLLGA